MKKLAAEKFLTFRRKCSSALGAACREGAILRVSRELGGSVQSQEVLLLSDAREIFWMR